MRLARAVCAPARARRGLVMSLAWDEGRRVDYIIGRRRTIGFGCASLCTANSADFELARSIPPNSLSL